ncbi:zinc finger, CCHC-type containing protein [Tanacetum coccineum]
MFSFAGERSGLLISELLRQKCSGKRDKILCRLNMKLFDVINGKVCVQGSEELQDSKRALKLPFQPRLPRRQSSANKVKKEENTNVAPVTAIPNGRMDLDIGPDSVETFNKHWRTPKKSSGIESCKRNALVEAYQRAKTTAATGGTDTPGNHKLLHPFRGRSCSDSNRGGSGESRVEPIKEEEEKLAKVVASTVTVISIEPSKYFDLKVFTRLSDYCDHYYTRKIEVIVIMTTGESVKEMTSKFDKLAKFKGQDFRRWQKKMHFLLTTLKVV